MSVKPPARDAAWRLCLCCDLCFGLIRSGEGRQARSCLLIEQLINLQINNRYGRFSRRGVIADQQSFLHVPIHVRNSKLNFIPFRISEFTLFVSHFFLSSLLFYARGCSNPKSD